MIILSADGKIYSIKPFSGIFEKNMGVCNKSSTSVERGRVDDSAAVVLLDLFLFIVLTKLDII